MSAESLLSFGQVPNGKLDWKVPFLFLFSQECGSTDKRQASVKARKGSFVQGMENEGELHIFIFKK